MANKSICMLLTNEFDPDVRVYKEAEYLVGRGFSVDILCWYRDINKDYPKEEVLDGIRIIRFRIPSVVGTGYRQVVPYLKYIFAVRKYCKDKKYDYYHCNDLDGAIAWQFIKHKKSQMVFDMHEYYEDVGKSSEFKRRLMRKATIWFIKKSRFALYENDLYLRENYKSIRNKLLELKNYPDSKYIKDIGKTESEVFRIGYFGGLRLQIPEFTTLFKSVKGLNDVRVDLYGDGPDLESLQEIACDYDNVTVHGSFNGITELNMLYSNADVLYAGYRPWSDTRECAEVVKFFEAIVTGTPIIMTECYTSMASRINDNCWGITCDTLSVEQVRAAVMKLKTDRTFWNVCRENELASANNYDWNTEVKVLDRAYES